MINRNNRTSKTSGFLLLEIIVSVALFAMVGTAMVAALHHMSQTSNLARDEIAMHRRFESILAEIAHGSGDRLPSGDVTYPPDGSGISVKVEILPGKLTNARGEILDSIYNVTMTGTLAGDPNFERVSQRMIYFKPHGRPQN